MDENEEAYFAQVREAFKTDFVYAERVAIAANTWLARKHAQTPEGKAEAAAEREAWLASPAGILYTQRSERIRAARAETAARKAAAVSDESGSE